MYKHILIDLDNEKMEFEAEQRALIVAYVNQSGCGIFSAPVGEMERPKLSTGYELRYELRWENLPDSSVWTIFFYHPEKPRTKGNRVYVGQLTEKLCTSEQCGGFIYIYKAEQNTSLQYTDRYKRRFIFNYINNELTWSSQ